MAYQISDLPYDYSALEPHIDARTMEIHHTKHHQAYVTNLNKALEGHPSLQDQPVEKLISNLSQVPEEIRRAVRNHGGGHANHSLFWNIMKKDGGGEPGGDLASTINEYFGSFSSFQEQFNQAAGTHFGSGWAWLAMESSGKLIVESTSNQDSPIMSGRIPIMGLDVWEHAYYLNYQNRRPDYISAWWNVVNWDAVASRFQEAQSSLRS
jgi:Fe-Mn family superoxide dismutase